jgi:E3 ubiquitin-protein ligase ZSWIM2
VCSCPTFTREKELCVHLLWVMLKVFRVDKHDEMIFQLQLVEREISVLLEARNMQIQKNQERVDNAQKEVLEYEETTLSVKKREIEAGDVCPICQDDLLAEFSPQAPTLHCRLSCGNSIHSKCLKILLDHHVKSGQASTLNCPLCRKQGFGTIDEIQAQLTDMDKIKREQKQKDKIRHYGSTCSGCKKSPITGDVFRCVACTVC